MKPANIKITSTSAVKVLDFGLAKALEAAASSPYVSVAATLTSPTVTGHGVILGTAAYMSPEQARAKPVDKRTDLWAFGCVLYEMLTGRRPFEGDEATDVIARIIERDIDFTLLPPRTPPSIRRLLRRSLEKDRGRRLADASDARLEIDEALGSSMDERSVDSRAGVHVSPVGWRPALLWGVATIALLSTAGVLALWAPWRSTPLAAPVRLNSELGVDASLVPDQGASAVLSPDGALLARREASPFCPSMLRFEPRQVPQMSQHHERDVLRQPGGAARAIRSFRPTASGSRSSRPGS